MYSVQEADTMQFHIRQEYILVHLKNNTSFLTFKQILEHLHVFQKMTRLKSTVVHDVSSDIGLSVSWFFFSLS